MAHKLEDQIKDFAHDQGVDVVGLAGPERLDGPPSLDLDYSMSGARSVISMALPMKRTTKPLQIRPHAPFKKG